MRHLSRSGKRFERSRNTEPDPKSYTPAWHSTTVILRESHEGIHRWLFRRWNAVSVAATSFWGLAFSFPLGYAIGIPLLRMWLLPVSIFAAHSNVYGGLCLARYNEDAGFRGKFAAEGG